MLRAWEKQDDICSALVLTPARFLDCWFLEPVIACFRRGETKFTAKRTQFQPHSKLML